MADSFLCCNTAKTPQPPWRRESIRTYTNRNHNFIQIESMWIDPGWEGSRHSSWGEYSSLESRGMRGNPYQATFTYQRALPAGLVLPSNKVLSFKAKRLSCNAQFCSSFYSSLVETKQLCFQKAQGDNSPCWWFAATLAVSRWLRLH